MPARQRVVRGLIVLAWCAMAFWSAVPSPMACHVPASSAQDTPVPPPAWLASLTGCTGVVVGPGPRSSLVLTAWHCFDEAVSTTIQVGGKTTTMRWGFRSAAQDLVLVEVSDPFDALPLAGSVPRPGQRAAQLGYGSPTSGQWPTRASLIVRDFKECDDAVKADRACGKQTERPARGICAGQAGNRVETGDSGGPLLIPRGSGWAVAGITKSSASSVTGHDMFESVVGLDVCAWKPKACPKEWEFEPLMPPLKLDGR